MPRVNTKIINTKNLHTDTVEYILQTVAEGIKGNKDLMQEMLDDDNKLFEFEIPVSAAEMRREYLLGNITSEFVAQYDMFKKTETITEVSIIGFKIVKLVVRDIY